jgi:hypothetical protein
MHSLLLRFKLLKISLPAVFPEHFFTPNGAEKFSVIAALVAPGRSLALPEAGKLSAPPEAG